MFEVSKMPLMMSFAFLYKMGNDLVHVYMNHPEVEKLLSSDESFDVCVIEIFNADAFLVRNLFGELSLSQTRYLRALLIVSIAFLSLTQHLVLSSGLMT